jgi:hypothetical protein
MNAATMQMPCQSGPTHARVISQRGGPPGDKTGYGPAGHVTTAGPIKRQGIIGNSRLVNRTQVLESAPATDSPTRKHAPLAPLQPSTWVLTKLRTAMINTSQHNLRRADKSPG